MTTTDEALRVAREALEQISKVGYGLDSSDDDAAQADYWAGKAIHQRELARSALRTIALAAEAPKPEPCPLGKGQNDPDCTNRHQCWEPCGELGKSEDHVRVGQEPAAKFSPAVQSVALAGGWGELRKDFDFDLASASGAVGETAPKPPKCPRCMGDGTIDQTGYGEYRPCPNCNPASPYYEPPPAAAGLPGTSNGQEN